MLGRIIFAAVSVLGGVMSAPALAGVPGCPEAGQVVSYGKISELSGGFTGNLDPGDRFGFSMANIDDLDGDGVTDLAVGAYADDDGGIERGAVYILFMNADGTVRGHQKISSTVDGFTGPLDNNDSFGNCVALGDLDGDGVADLGVGAQNGVNDAPRRFKKWVGAGVGGGRCRGMRRDRTRTGVRVRSPTQMPASRRRSARSAPAQPSVPSIVISARRSQTLTRNCAESTA